jgi:hypothetical protein
MIKDEANTASLLAYAAIPTLNSKITSNTKSAK